MKPYSFSLFDHQPPISVEAYRRKASRRLPKIAWNYVDNGADDLVSLRQNRSAYQGVRLRQRSLSGVTAPAMNRTIMGVDVAMPLGLAPTGLSGMTRWCGDVASARAAENAGTRFALSSGSVYTIEEVAQATRENHWFQLYANGNRDMVRSLIQRAQSAGYAAMMVTVDTAVAGNREGERRHGAGVPLKLTAARCLDMALHPQWLAELIHHRRLAPANYEPAAPRAAGDRGLAETLHALEAQTRNMRADLVWEDMAWMRDQWKGRFYIKGIMDAEDAVRAVSEVGADGVVVSNHGGRQLDTVPGTFDALRQIAPRLKGRGEVYVDGGVRRGTDVIKALCVGAQGVFIGRPYLYGLAVHGQQGVENILAIFRDEIRRALTLMGCPSAAELDTSWLLNPDGTAFSA